MVRTKTLKVLVLDFSAGFLPNLSAKGITFDVTLGEDNGSKAYKISERAPSADEQKTFDLIIIGNNKGAGRYKAGVITQDMKEKTIIVWNDYTPGKGIERHYTDLGFKNFSSREEADIEKIIFSIIGKD